MNIKLLYATIVKLLWQPYIANSVDKCQYIVVITTWLLKYIVKKEYDYNTYPYLAGKEIPQN